MYKSITQHQTDLDFQRGFQGFKNILAMYKVNINIYIFVICAINA